MAREPHRPDPSALRAWQRIFRDFTCVVVGAFMLVWQTVFAATPNALIVGAGLVALGLPPAFRFAENGKDNGNGGS